MYPLLLFVFVDVCRLQRNLDVKNKIKYALRIDLVNGFEITKLRQHKVIVFQEAD